MFHLPENHSILYAARMSETVKSLFTSISPTYDRLNHVLSFNIDKIWRKKTIAWIEKPQNSCFQMLDLCAGTFDLSLECLRQFPNCQIVAADFSLGMLNAGISKIKTQKLKGKIVPVCADALNLPFSDNSMDVIICGYGFRNFDDAEKGIREANRVLKKGGQLLVLDFFKPNSVPAKIFHKTYAKFVIPTLGKLISGHQSAYVYLKNSIQGFLTADEFKNLLKKNSFKDTKSKDFIFAISSVVSAIKI